jgi:hypothetical protein
MSDLRRRLGLTWPCAAVAGEENLAALVDASG